MRAEQVIATHGNTDFDAFGAMLAARLLYPDAVVAVGTLNRNVRDFYRLHAEELGAVAEVSRLELDAIRRLIVVEVTSASRLGDLESVALDPDGREGALRPPRGARASRVGLRGDGGAVRRTARSRRRSSGSSPSGSSTPTPLEATAFALGIHEDTGSLTYATTTQRDIDALSWCFRHGARQDLVNEYLHAPLAPTERGLLQHLLDALEPIEPHGDDVLLACVTLAGVRRRGVEPRAQDRRSHRCPGARPPRRDGRAGVRRRAEQNGADRRGRDRRRARRRGSRTGGLGDLA